MIAFVSGHLDLTEDEFDLYYRDQIDFAILRGDEFVVGDARGADAMFQQYIEDKFREQYSEGRYMNSLIKECVTVYHMFESPRNNVGNFRTKGGYISDDERDLVMTNESTYDIAWVRKGRENSGTAKNINRRCNK